LALLPGPPVVEQEFGLARLAGWIGLEQGPDLLQGRKRLDPARPLLRMLSESHWQ